MTDYDIVSEGWGGGGGNERVDLCWNYTMSCVMRGL